MRQLILAATTFLLVGGVFAADGAPNPQMVLDTSEGVIVIELFQERAPKSVANIIQYVDDGFYTETIFHRVIQGFMIQGGGFGQDMVKKGVREPVENEADNGLKNDRGTVALARTSNPHSATAQFYINLIDNDSLDYRTKTERGWGYTVFGRVVEGMNVVDRIARARTQTRGRMRDVPALPIVIERASVRYPEAEAAEGEEGG